MKFKATKLLLISLIFATACSESITETKIKKDEKVNVTNKSEVRNEVNKTITEQIYIKDQADLKQLVEADLQKANISADKVKFESSNPEVAKVDDKGLVTATGKGTASIKVIDTANNSTVKQLDINTNPPTLAQPSASPAPKELPAT
jgi:hypothetical protein